MSAKLQRVVLNARDPAVLADFYCQHLGMRRDPHGPGQLFGYGGSGAGLELRQATGAGAYRHANTDRYWKIGITVPDLDFACAELRGAGIEVTEPAQFRDIGYLCHLRDPEGFCVELLQHTFAGQPLTAMGKRGEALGGGAQVGQLTLRVTDIDTALDYFHREGFHLLSIQDVPDLAFCLYFLGLQDERPPDPDLRAVGNREWLWQRPYTTLELQHRAGSQAHVDTDGPGYAGFVIARDEAGRMLR